MAKFECSSLIGQGSSEPNAGHMTHKINALYFTSYLFEDQGTYEGFEFQIDLIYYHCRIFQNFQRSLNIPGRDLLSGVHTSGSKKALYTLDSGIELHPEITVATLLKIFTSRP